MRGKGPTCYGVAISRGELPLLRAGDKPPRYTDMSHSVRHSYKCGNLSLPSSRGELLLLRAGDKPPRYVRRCGTIRHFHNCQESHSVRHSRENGNPSSPRLTSDHFQSLNSLSLSLQGEGRSSGRWCEINYLALRTAVAQNVIGPAVCAGAPLVPRRSNHRLLLPNTEYAGCRRRCSWARGLLGLR